MGLFRAFVFFWDRRAVLAVFALSISLSYALLASATVYGLRGAQAGLGADLDEPRTLVVHPNFEPFDPSVLGAPPTGALAVQQTPKGTYYVARSGPGSIENGTGIVAGKASGLRPGTVVDVGGYPQVVLKENPPAGPSPDWVGLDEATFGSLGGAPPPLVHVAVYDELPSQSKEWMESAGLLAVEAPATRKFYVAGAEQLVSSIWVATAASTIVIAIVVSSVLDMEARARHRSLATLRLFAGPGRVRALLLARATALLAAGQLVGLLGTVALVVLLRRADVAPFSLQPLPVVLVMATTFLGGLAGTIPGLIRITRRLQAAELRGATPAAHRPRALRPLLTTWKNFPMLVAAGIVLSGTLSVAFGASQIPNMIFGVDDDADVIAAVGANPLRSPVPAFTGLYLHEVEGYTASSPEIFAPLIMEGRPVIVRGVSWEHLTRMDGVEVTKGKAPTAYGEVAFGARLARHLDVAMGETFFVPGAYTVSVLQLQLVGIVDAPGLLADEALVSLPTARALADVAPEDVNLIRVRRSAGTDPGRVPLLVPGGIEVTNLRLDPPDPRPNETAHAEVDVINFSPQPQTRTLTLRINGDPVANAYVSMSGSSAETQRFTFRVPQATRLRVEVNPTVETQSGHPNYLLEAPERTVLGTDVAVTVRHLDGRPAQAVTLSLAGQATASDGDGRTTLRPVAAGNYTLLAEGTEGRAARSVFVLEPQNVNRTVLVVRQVTGPSQIGAGTWTGSVLVENLGGKPHSGSVPLPVNGTPPAINQTVFIVGEEDIGPGQQRLLDVTVDLIPGSYRIGPSDGGLPVTVVEAGADAPETPERPPDAPTTVDELLQERRARVVQSLGQSRDATAAFLGDTFANLNAALTVVTLATLLHTGLVVMVTVLRGIEARSVNVGAFAVLGVSRGELRRWTVVEHLGLGAAAALAGVGLGLAISATSAAFGLLQGFGHTLRPFLGITFGLRLATVALALVLLAAVIAVEQVRGRSLRRLLAGGPERLERRDLADLLRDPRGSPP